MRSVVGLVLFPLTVFSGRLLAVPAITLNSVLLPDSKSPVQASAFHTKHHGLGSRDIGCYGDVVSVAFPGDLYDVRLVRTGHQRIIEIDDQIHIIALNHGEGVMKFQCLFDDGNVEQYELTLSISRHQKIYLQIDSVSFVRIIE